MQHGSLIRTFESMVRTFGSFDGQKQVGTGNAYIGRESSGRWSSIPMLWKLDGSPRPLRVVVRNNGRGIHPQKGWTGDAHWGLPGMRDRAESMGAKLTIWSGPDAGTEVEFRFPPSVRGCLPF